MMNDSDAGRYQRTLVSQRDSLWEERMNMHWLLQLLSCVMNQRGEVLLPGKEADTGTGEADGDQGDDGWPNGPATITGWRKTG